MVWMFRGAWKYVSLPGIKLQFLSHQVYIPVTVLTTLFILSSWTQSLISIVPKSTIGHGPEPVPCPSFTTSFSLGTVFPCPLFYNDFLIKILCEFPSSIVISPLSHTFYCHTSNMCKSFVAVQMQKDTNPNLFCSVPTCINHLTFKIQYFSVSSSLSY